MSIKKNGSLNNEIGKEVKEKTGNVNSSSKNLVAPDGGWGWIIVIASGFSNFCILPVLQSFGLLFKSRFAELGISSLQTTTILNINCAVTSCIGLANGPLFRKFSCRQVSFTGALICATSITILSTMESFTGVIIVFSILYGIGAGITMSSNALVLNTYFKKKRRIATGFSWTCTGMGPIVIPQIITLLMPIYGVEGTVLILGGLAFNAVACAILLQPISRHAKKEESTEALNCNEDTEQQVLSTCNKGATEVTGLNETSALRNRSCQNIDEQIRRSCDTLSQAKGKFGSQYLYYDDKEDGASGIDVLGPVTSMMARANDGWYSRKNTSTASLASKSSKRESISRNLSRRQSMNLSRQSSLIGSSVRNLNRQISETESYRRKLSGFQSTAVPLIIVNESCEHADDSENCQDPHCSKKSEQTSVASGEVETDELIKEEYPEEVTKKNFLEILIIFFELDLLRDPVFVNMMLGITFASFAELNFSLLTPFILSEYGFSKIQVATVMSILAGVDVVTRLTIPFIADFIGWQNRTFYLVGICGVAAGRIVLAHVQDFGITIAVAVLIGCGKALRTIFMALIIPSHVPLSRLPGASGIQLLTSGIVSLSLGPVVGWVRDITSNYTIMLHCLNIFTYLTVISWSLEIFYINRKAKNEEKKKTLKISLAA